ncbi:MAG: hypothetical protein K0U84_15210 [Actinomycetia bacterium]|nr:hypothetical protein [Actinomycetes bacterium]
MKPVDTKRGGMMAAIFDRSAKLGALAIGAFTVSVAALTSGAGIAGASPNDPGMDRVGADGDVSSRQAHSVSGANHCDVSSGTLSTSEVRDTDHGTPMQRTNEAGPSWVGSDGWQAIGLSRSNPWGGSFNSRKTRTGLQCHDGSARRWR